MTENLPQACQDVIRAFFRLDFGDGRHVACPYFQNTPKRKKFGTTAEVGKGTPGEIVAETTARAYLHWSGVTSASAEEIRSFMVEEGIGVDCSGFAARVLDSWIRQKTGKSIGKALKPAGKPWWQKILFRVRPFHNLDVLTLTHLDNSKAVELSALMPGDLIKTRGGKHMLLVSKVTYGDGAVNVGAENFLPLQEFTYVHSSQAFGDESGVREGMVHIMNLRAPLEQQDWQEIWNGRKPTLEGWMEKREQNGIFRLNVLA